MDSKQESGGVGIGNRQRKFGLPDWMVNNMERLNFATDFEQYACSPPEGEGFLSESMEHHVTEEPSCPIVDPIEFQDNKVVTTPEVGVRAEKCHPSSLLRETTDHSSTQYRSILKNMRHDEHFSSPDSTPCATPEPSPVIRRKVSIPHPDDTVLTNPGRWFYIGKLNKPTSSYKGQSVGLCRNEGNKAMSSETDSLKKKGNGIKLVISNFDLNAVSPNSW